VPDVRNAVILCAGLGSSNIYALLNVNGKAGGAAPPAFLAKSKKPDEKQNRRYFYLCQ
jgi:hypothetical protein